MFGDLSVAGIGKDLKEALNEQTQNLENLMGSQYSLNKVRIYLLLECHKKNTLKKQFNLTSCFIMHLYDK